MDQVTADVHQISVEGQRLWITVYAAFCGCEWSVDMWGNVMAVHICERDMDDKRWGSGQFTLQLVAGE